MPSVVIAGGSGFIGQAIIKEFQALEWQVTVLSRTPKAPANGVEYVLWDGERLGDWVKSLATADAVINLSGAPIAAKWTLSELKHIRESRVRSTSAIGNALREVGKPFRWVNGSAVGAYGSRGDEVLTEESAPGDTGAILPGICAAWEAAARDHCPGGCHLTLVRTGFVLGNEGGAFPVLTTLVRAFMGGHPGSGNQWVPWIHVADIAKMFVWSASEDQPAILNGCAPHPCRMADFMAQLRTSLRRPWSPPVPAFALQIASLLGTPDPSLLLDSCRAIPKAAEEAGFKFQYPHLADALKNLK